MGHVASHFVPLDPNLEAENELLALVPQLMAELMKGAGLRPYEGCWFAAHTTYFGGGKIINTYLSITWMD